MRFRSAELSVGQVGRDDDRCAVLQYADRLVLAICDGAGGTRRGADAADHVIRAVARCAEAGTFDAVALLRECDETLAESNYGGETTAVVVSVNDQGISGASVGDSGAWLFDDDDPIELTHEQLRKPLIGSGEAIPIAFSRGPLNGTLLLASDGLLKYADISRIREILMTVEIEDAPETLVSAVRLRSGALQDDTTVAVCRRE